MAGQNEGGGSPSSFTNTPQAQDDLYNGGSIGLAQDNLGIVYLNVMDNDLGGNAKALWSLDNGVNDTGALDDYIAGDLLAEDAGRDEATSTDHSSNGARIWITPDGEVGYDASTLSDDFKAQLNALQAGESLTDTFIYAIRLGNGTLSWATATVEFAGRNDSATIAGDDSGNLTEDAVAPATGTLTVSDPDDGEAHTQAVAAAAHNSESGLGAYSVDADGHWSYTVDNALVQHLTGTGSVTDTFTVLSQDGSAQQTVTITIQGLNDAAAIAGDDDGTLTEDAAAPATGTLTVGDVDDGEAHTQAVAAAAHNSGSGLGAYSVDADGHWSYTVDNALVQHLTGTDSVTDTFTIFSQDGTAQQTVTITIQGLNDPAGGGEGGGIAGDDSGNLTEDAVAPATGTLTVSDPDDGEAHTQAVAAAAHNSESGLGAYSVDADGHWSYTVDNALVQHLTGTGSVTDTFTVLSQDGSAQQTVTITIQGLNDAAAIAGDDDGTLTEDAAAPATGTLTVGDVDDGEAHTQAVAAAAHNSERRARRVFGRCRRALELHGRQRAGAASHRYRQRHRHVHDLQPGRHRPADRHHHHPGAQRPCRRRRGRRDRRRRQRQPDGGRGCAGDRHADGLRPRRRRGAHASGRRRGA